MNLLHVGVAAFNLLCLGALATAFAVGAGKAREGFAAFAVVGGYFANMLALLVFAILLVLLSVRAFSNAGGATLRAHWLGFANGAAVLLAWAAFFGLGKQWL